MSGWKELCAEARVFLERIDQDGRLRAGRRGWSEFGVMSAEVRNQKLSGDLGVFMLNPDSLILVSSCATTGRHARPAIRELARRCLPGVSSAKLDKHYVTCPGSSALEDRDYSTSNPLMLANIWMRLCRSRPCRYPSSQPSSSRRKKVSRVAPRFMPATFCCTARK